MALMRKLDEINTKQNARKVLSSYRSLKRRLLGASIDPLATLRSPEISDMPSNKSNINGVEKALIHELNDVNLNSCEIKKLNDMDRALNALSEVSRRILELSYCEQDKYTMNDISAKLVVVTANELGQFEERTYSVKRIEQLKDEALLQFAEAFRGGELLEFQN